MSHSKAWRRTLWLAGTVLTALWATRAAQAGPVSGTIYDTDYLKAQPKGFGGVKYPRYTHADGSDAGQMVYAYNADIYDNGNVFAFVLDVTTGAVAPVQPVTTSSGQVLGKYTYSFANLVPGKHQLQYVEPYREEVYTPSSKRATATVLSSNAPVTRSFHLVRQWRLNPVLPTPVSHSNAVTTGSLSYVDALNGWFAVSTDNGQGPAGRFADDIYGTQDGGKTWTKLAHIPAPVGLYFGTPTDSGNMLMPTQGLHFSDTLHGVLIVWTTNLEFVTPAFSTYTTSDGGLTWTPGNVNWQIDEYYGSLTFEAVWDQSNPKHGMFYSPRTQSDSTILYTRVTQDGGQTWSNGQDFAGPDIGAYAGGAQKLFDFSGGNYCNMAWYNNPGVILLSATNAWQTLTGSPDGDLAGPFDSGGYYSGRAGGQSAIAPIVVTSDGSTHNFRTDDGGASWNHVYWYNRQEGYGGSLAHSYGYLSAMCDLMADGSSCWLWNNGVNSVFGRSMDGCLSRSWMGVLGVMPVSAYLPGAFDDAPDIHTGRRVYVMEPTTDFTMDILSFTFAEQTSHLPASIMPIATLLGYHYNAAPGLYLNLVNVGGNWATGVTIDSISATNGVTFSSAQPLPWNIGAIPPGSTTNQAINYNDPGEIYFTANVPSGVNSYSVTLTGHYNTSKTFSVTVSTP